MNLSSVIIENFYIYKKKKMTSTIYTMKKMCHVRVVHLNNK